jgi:hypothetical protein
MIAACLCTYVSKCLYHEASYEQFVNLSYSDDCLPNELLVSLEEMLFQHKEDLCKTMPEEHILQEKQAPSS